MNAEGVARLFARRHVREGPFPEHYEPFESPVANPLHPKVPRQPGGAGVQGRHGTAFGMANRLPVSSRRPTG